MMTNAWSTGDDDESLNPELKNLANLAAALSTNSPALQLKAVAAFRKLLSKADNPPVAQVIAAGVVTRFVEFIGPQYRENNKLQFEASWALTNIASSDHTALIVELGAVQPLCDLLASEHAEIRDQAAWCLGNIAGDSVSLRDALLVQGVLPRLLPNITEAASVTMLRNCTWALSNFCRHKPSPPIKKIKPALPVLANILNTCKDGEVLTDGCWALSYISDGDDERIKAVVDTGVVPSLIRLLGHAEDRVSICTECIECMHKSYRVQGLG
jgi:hypothetical protein